MSYDNNDKGSIDQWYWLEHDSKGMINEERNCDF